MSFLERCEGPRAAPRRTSPSACRGWWAGRRRCGCARGDHQSRIPRPVHAAGAGRRPSGPSPVARAKELELLDVLGEVAAGHPLVDELLPGDGVKGLQSRLHVMAGDALSGMGRPSARCARITAIQNSRSNRTLPAGDHRARIASLAYRWASTLGISVMIREAGKVVPPGRVERSARPRQPTSPLPRRGKGLR
jgi:hypothetical protein